VLKKFAQSFAKGPCFTGGLVSRFHLPQNLWFAQNHGIQAASHSKHVADEIAIGMAVQIRRKVGGADLLALSDPVDQDLFVRCGCCAVKLGAVTG